MISWNKLFHDVELFEETLNNAKTACFMYIYFDRNYGNMPAPRFMSIFYLS